VSTVLLLADPTAPAPSPTPTSAIPPGTTTTNDSGVDAYWHVIWQIAAVGAATVICLVLSAALIIGIWIGLRKVVRMSMGAPGDPRSGSVQPSSVQPSSVQPGSVSPSGVGSGASGSDR
jgi:hypothetical protein